MNKTLSTVRGMRDIRGLDAQRLTTVELAAQKVLSQYGYSEIRLPLVEHTELFKRGVGETNDTVGKEMYTFDDRDGESLSLRPEGTASCARAVINNSLARGSNPRLWYAGSMFRHERPQRGRYREFRQVGAEVFGLAGPSIDAELVEICWHLWRELGIEDAIQLRINSLGSKECQIKYRELLVEFLTPLQEKLDEDSQRRLRDNPLRILDSKIESTQALLESAPTLEDALDEASAEHFAKMQSYLTAANVPFEIDTKLVRGLDYYTHVVVEWHTSKLGSQSQIGGGGRYDDLVSTLGGAPTPAAGFGLGIDRIALLLEAVDREQSDKTRNEVDVFVIALAPELEEYRSKVARSLRSFTDLRIMEERDLSKNKAKFREADRSGASYCIVLGEDELEGNTATVKNLRANEKQITLSIDSLPSYLNDALDANHGE